MFTAYQIDITREDSDLINRLGWSEAEKASPKVAAYLKYSHNHGKIEFDPADAKYYSQVAMVDSSDPEEVFAVLNGMGREDIEVKVRKNYRSLSVGDIIVSAGKRLMVAGFGFEPVDFDYLEAN